MNNIAVYTVNSSPKYFENLNLNVKMINSQGIDHVIISNCGYKNDSAKIYYFNFTYFNEAFYFSQDIIKRYDYIMLLDDDDMFSNEKIPVIKELIYRFHQNNEAIDYIHNKASYDCNYPYNNINHNNSCITVKTTSIDFRLYQKTRSLSDFLLWLSCRNHIDLENRAGVLTVIPCKKMNYEDFSHYMNSRYSLRYEDLVFLFYNFPEYRIHIKKELFKYAIILHKNRLKYLSIRFDKFTILHFYKPTDWYIRREYELMNSDVIK